MSKVTKMLVSFLKKEDGPTAVEYAVMLALIIVVCLVAITTLGQQVNNTFSNVGEKLKSAAAQLGVTGILRGAVVQGESRWLRTADPQHLAIHASAFRESI